MPRVTSAPPPPLASLAGAVGDVGATPAPTTLSLRADSQPKVERRGDEVLRGAPWVGLAGE